MRRSLVLIPSFALLFLTGCGRYGARTTFYGGLLAYEILRDASAQAERQPAPDVEPSEDAQSPPEGPVAHEPASDADTAGAPDKPFDLGGAYGALARVDLGKCKEQGLTSGYGRVVIAFAGDGSAVGVGLTMPSGSAAASRVCVESAFREVRVAPYDGGPVNVRRAFFVR